MAWGRGMDVAECCGAVVAAMAAVTGERTFDHVSVVDVDSEMDCEHVSVADCETSLASSLVASRRGQDPAGLLIRHRDLPNL